MFPGGAAYLHHTFVNPGATPRSGNDQCPLFDTCATRLRSGLTRHSQRNRA